MFYSSQTLAVAINLTNNFIRYNNSVQYQGVPEWNPAAKIIDLVGLNSNTGTSTLLAMAGINPTNMDVTFKDGLADGTAALNGSVAGQTLNLDGPPPTVNGTFATLTGLDELAPGWEDQLPKQDFNTNIKGIVQQFADITTDPVAALLDSPYVHNLLLENNFAGAFTGDLGTLSDFVGAIERIKKGGLLNILSGGLDLARIGEELGILPKYIDGTPIAQYFQEIAQGLKTYAGALQILAQIPGIESDWDKGGISGAVAAGTATDALLWQATSYLENDHWAAQLLGSLINSGGGAWGGPEVIAFESSILPIAVAVGLAVLVFGGHHDNPAQMPDKYDTARFTQYVGELQGSAATAYGPAYDPSSDPIQSQLGGLPLLQYIETWVKTNINSSSPEIQRLAQQLYGQYGDTGSGKLTFQHNIGNESVAGGALSGTYVTLHEAAGQAVGEIRTLMNEVAPSPIQSYGGLQWTAFMTAEGSTGFWAPDGNGMYYYFGPSGTLYHDAYPDEVHPQDVTSNAVGNVATYVFPPQPALPPPTQDYGGLSWNAFKLPTGDTGYWAPTGTGNFYYFGPNNTLYIDSYPGAVHSGDTGNAVGDVTTYQFPS